ncbi:homoserine kinase [Fodinibius salsisoli]|uniref:Homoserine kinase n=1 Tax=Fodinibius salsisoli TaxID=2820877 RepID=A0ABT3PSS1_9BACT|nr:homoserine kinase [Fodinibius salsisoli]MCW9708912.1 homoserine kinase [Fodinibius salsisoli]
MSEFKYKEVRVFAPASVANVSCGFDVMGFALGTPGDEIIVRQNPEGEGVTINKVTGDEGVLPLDADKNTASVAVQALFRSLGFDGGVAIEVHKQMPLGSGLGSSAASAAGAVLAANHLLGNPLARKALLPFAAEAEKAACGTAHYDNVGPSLLGGFVFIRSSEAPDILNLSYPENLHAVVVHPQIEIKTGDTRKILRNDIQLGKAVKQWGNVGGLVAGLMTKDLDLMARSMEDVIIEPIRSVLIPGYDAVKKAALDAGAIGAGIAGSGPSIFALTADRQIAEKVSKRMKAELDGIGLPSDEYISEINTKGSKVIDVKS